MPVAHRSDNLAAALADALSTGATILAPSERAARRLRTQSDAMQAAGGNAVWAPAPVYSLSTWLGMQWSALTTAGHEARLLLNPAQEHLLWSEAIAAGPELGALGPTDALATLASTAWRLAADFDALADLRRHATTHDARTFAAWAAVFRKRCTVEQCLSSAELPSAVREHITRQTLTPPPGLVLIGCDDLRPAQASLFEALAVAGSDVTHITLTQPVEHGATRTIASAPDPATEARAAAHRIRTCVEQRSAAGLPHHVALLVPSLADEREPLDSLLREVLAPELEDVARDLSSAPFAFSTGTSLADATLIATALDLLRWATEPLAIDAITTLLLSPYLGNFTSLADRAAFDAFTLRDRPPLRPELSLNAVLRRAPAGSAVHALLAPLHDAARSVTATSSTPTARRTYAEWTEVFRTLLRSANWPGDRSLNATEFQQALAFEHVLDAVATLDFSGPRPDLRTALTAVERQARQALSAPSPNATVEVMTPLEAAGSAFDAVVFLRATDVRWPAPERPNPLLGWSLQAERGMPGTDPALTTARMQRFTDTLLSAATHALITFPREDETGHQRLSPTFAALGWPRVKIEEIAPIPPAVTPLPMEAIEDSTPVPALSVAAVRGGANVLKLQAACAFRAFAEIRLHASAIDTPALGLDPRDNGGFLHAALGNFWQEVHDQDSLRALSAADRDRILDQAIAEGLSSTLPRGFQATNAWDSAYLTLQQARMKHLLTQWLDRELDREPFTVLELEQKKQVAVGPLTFELRIDRIDALAGGGTMLVDYKTGASSKPADWVGDRPDDPQLPLYAMLPEASGLKAIAFARVRPGKEMKWLGYAETPAFPKPATMPFATMEKQVAEWRSILDRLAHDFFHGNAGVSPKDYPGTCRHCAQRLLCRLDSVALAAEESEDADAEL